MMKPPSGVFAPVVTTFYSESGDVDLASFAANIRAHLAAGMHGVVVTGSTGEAALLDLDERAALVDTAREMVPPDRRLIVGTGAESTRACLKLTRDAAARGADAVLVVAPHYYGAAMTGAALSNHYHAVADGSPIPVMLYSIPKYMHFAVPASLVAELAQHENVIGIKDSSGNRELFATYMPAQSPTFSVLNGNAQMWHHALTVGSRGGILAVALFAAGLAMEIYEAERRGDHDGAAAAQARLTPLGARVVGEMGVAGVKAAMDLVGLAGGPVRSPLMPLDDAQRGVVGELMSAAELVAA
ncbi:MAG TPA: dihydrodipicolinate synthase family protein [Gemmatimonadaceae bacterium]|nr:dihydrodipicolinate synthase family protein [Gemmatimonadaceae bacterium]